MNWRIYRYICLSAMMLAGCGRSSPTTKPALIVISGDTDGWIVPCGCTANQSGGLLRRGTYLNDLRKTANLIYADVGGATSGNSPYQQAKLEAILNGEKQMGIAAHNLGKSELAFGPDALRNLATKTGVTFISANTRATDGQPLALPLIILPLDGKRIALVGVVDPTYATNQITADDPRSAIMSIIASHRTEFDSLIVLAYMPQNELSKLADALPEADAVVGGPTGQPIVPTMQGHVLLAAATSKGKFLARLQVPQADHPWTGAVDELGPTLADDPTQLENLHAYLAILGQRDFSAAQSGLVPPIPTGVPADYRIAGSTSCISCHAAESAQWQSTHHASAWTTLVNKGFQVDSYCQQCHTTGYGLPGGFESRSQSMALVSVGCESCHGPSLAHVHDPHVHTPFDAMDQCVRCHDQENSPQFDRPTYWAEIRHSATQPAGAKS
jgi:Cytochrome c554 and c-prime